MSRRPSLRARPPLALAVAAAAVAALVPGSGRAATPAQATLSAPDQGKVTTSWSGSVDPGVGGNPNAATLRCTSVNPLADQFTATLGLPSAAPSFYATHVARLTLRIEWTPVVNPTVNNLQLTAIQTPAGSSTSNYVDANGTGVTAQQAVFDNPVAGTYVAGACPLVNGTPQTYTGTATLEVALKGSAPTATPVTGLAFAPATIVSANATGAEPQTTSERVTSFSVPGALDPNRVFVDWPWSTALNASLLHRSVNGGNSYRAVLDPLCYSRSRPNCLTLGGGDSVNRVDLRDGTLYFGDQEVVANEAIATSHDHGDTFPAQAQFAATNAITGVDRQWIAPVQRAGVTVNGVEIRAFYTYHIPAAGLYAIGIDANGTPIPQPVPQVAAVSQSGPSRVDTTGGPGDLTLYAGYRDSGGFHVAHVPVASYQLPTAWSTGVVTTDVPDIFPWINLDDEGNLYAVWTTNGVIKYAYSLITDPANDPKLGGTPATRWSTPVRVTPPQVGSAVFPEVTAGSAGRIAVAYLGTTDYTGKPDGAPGETDNTHLGALWNVYASVITNATDLGGPTITTGLVSHKPAHTGSVCTSGTTCTGDRSLLDMIDVTVDEDGRPGVVFTDNNSQFGRDTGSAGIAGNPFVKFAKMTTGPSLFSGHAPIAIPLADTGYRAAAAGDATWPNTAGSQNLPSLDILGAALWVDGSDVVGRIDLANAGTSQMTTDLAAYNAATPTQPVAATRLLYTLRWETAAQIHHLDVDVDTSGRPQFFGGTLTSTDSAVSDGLNTVGAAYARNSSTPPTVTGSIVGNSLVFRARQSDFEAAPGSLALSVTAVAQAAPSEVNALLAPSITRTVDASFPFDTHLATSPNSLGPGPAGSTPTVAPTATAIPTTTTVTTPNTAAAGAPAAAAGAAALGLLLGLCARRRRSRGRGGA